MSNIYVIGIGQKPLDERAREIILRAEVILASNRLSEVFKRYEEFEMVGDAVRVINNVDETINYMKSAISGPQPGTIALLASGDPLFFGIGRRIIEEFGKEAVEILPDLSSIQIAFARIKEPWDDAFLMSIHGGPDPKRRRRLPYRLEDVPLLLEKHGKVAILTDRTNNPQAIAKTILRLPVRMYVCEKLGYADEKITEGSPEGIANGEFSDPNVVIIHNTPPPYPLPQGEGESLKAPSPLTGKGEGGGELPAPETRFGLTEKEIHHSRGLITKDEIRAVTLHKLRLPQRGVFWDVGAGSGSVSIEAARLCPGLEVFAIEKDEEQVGNIRTNCERFNAKNIEILHGKAPEVLEGLPSPGRVFIGGSGSRLDEIIALIKRGMPSGIVVLNAATLETLQEAIACLEKNGFKVGIAEVSVSKSKVIAGKKHMSALNPVFIITGEKGI
ncbi:MAG: precorrin-6y C5,15-methyltransferase (decarboxylating) subunit CbiE [Nitrospirae bacterium]|nr:precorrin-6y C5,15-methyltransferase (decarboxylating) subunit CbiE [Nitrospirota bacterium]MCL5423071.1 precorrin-6y C5,15-methyltransferase (decarboxylating) subunit CbiE [Nitrospirota bacterium]